MNAVAATLVLILAGCGPGNRSTSQGSPWTAVEALLAADSAFSVASTRTDLVTGLSAMFTDNVIMPIPGAGFADGKAAVMRALRANPDNARSRAEWTPVRGGIAADGQQGFTFGYMTVYRPDSTRVPIKYLAYWIKGPNGWRVAAYKRRPRPDAPVPLTRMPPAVPAAMTPATADSAATERFRLSLEQAERAFSDEAQRTGLGPAFVRNGTADAMNMGGQSDTTFVMGSEAIGRLVSAGGGDTTTSAVSWAADYRVIVASSGDLGVTFGIIRQNAPPAGENPPRTFPFFTVWRRGTTTAPWRYIAE